MLHFFATSRKKRNRLKPLKILGFSGVCYVCYTFFSIEFYKKFFISNQNRRFFRNKRNSEKIVYFCAP